MIVKTAAEFAMKYHSGQLRKWSNEPYIKHPARVALKVSGCSLATDEIVAVAWIHDTLEDCPEVTPQLIEGIFGEYIVRLVIQLTNKSKGREGLTRAERKALDRHYLSLADKETKLIKLADRIDNLSDIRDVPQDFALKYKKESLLLLEVLRGIYQPFEKELEELCKNT